MARFTASLGLLPTTPKADLGDRCRVAFALKRGRRHPIGEMGDSAVEGRWVICPRFCDYLGLEAVAHSGLGDEVARPSGIVFKLVSECLDVLA